MCFFLCFVSESFLRFSVSAYAEVAEGAERKRIRAG